MTYSSVQPKRAQSDSQGSIKPDRPLRTPDFSLHTQFHFYATKLSLLYSSLSSPSYLRSSNTLLVQFNSRFPDFGKGCRILWSKLSIGSPAL
ncbi:hypothetical protein ACTXT7_013890 [Hymenolepis weldensis]